MDRIENAKMLLQRVGKINLGFYPTPLQRLDRISNEYEINLYAKREDFSGMTLFGGNKIRKLEYLLNDAKNKGCDTVFTYGATQSNHAMETATAVRKCGMTPVPYLAAHVNPDAADIRANLLLDTYPACKWAQHQRYHSGFDCGYCRTYCPSAAGRT